MSERVGRGGDEVGVGRALVAQETFRKGGSIRVMRLKSTWSRKMVAVCALLLCAVAAGVAPVFAQLNTRMLLTTGTEVPGHGGLAFGPFLSVAMNGNQDIIFLTSLRSPRVEMRAVVRSMGVSFSVVAFQGLLGPYPRTTYDTFSAPSLNDSGVIAFTATLATDQTDVPTVVVVRQEGSKPRAVATNMDAPPGQTEVKFEEFSAPLVSSDGNVLFGARWSGKDAGSGLFLWSPRGLQALQLPVGLQLGPKELLEPFFVGHDEAAFLRRGTPVEVATEQFFRAIAIQSFQELQPPPDPTHTGELLAARADVGSVQMLLVYLENGSIQTALLAGDPTKPVMAKQSLSTTPLKSVGRILSLTIGPRGNMIFAAAPTDAPNDLALYCNCDGQENRLTTADDFLPITTAGPGKPILSLTGDTQQTIAFIAPTNSGDNTGIYVTAIH
ncbi:MAG TPA: hypothetical protein VKO18_20325 [Terriglobia bacterium]|nr:hypothetical protein [Terriglobia bacterium]